jgi:hypothetical protein
MIPCSSCRCVYQVQQVAIGAFTIAIGIGADCRPSRNDRVSRQSTAQRAPCVFRLRRARCKAELV